MAFLLPCLVLLLLFLAGFQLVKHLKKSRRPPTPSGPPKHLLDLPPELLQKILGLVFRDSGIIIPQNALYRSVQQLRRAAPPRDHLAVFLVCHDLYANSKAAFFQSIILSIPTVALLQNLSFCTLRTGLRHLQRLEMSPVVLHVLKWQFIIDNFPELRLLILTPFVMSTTDQQSRQREARFSEFANEIIKGWEEQGLSPLSVPQILGRDGLPLRNDLALDCRRRERALQVMRHIHGTNPRQAFLGNEDGDDWHPRRIVPRLRHEHYRDCVHEMCGLWDHLEPALRELPSGIKDLQVKLEVRLRITNALTGEVTWEVSTVSIEGVYSMLTGY